MGGRTQVGCSFVGTGIFGWACLQAGRVLNKGRNIPEIAAL